MVELEEGCFAEARNLRDLDGGAMRIDSFCGKSIVCYLVDWDGLTSISSWETRWLDYVEKSWMPKASRVSPRTTTSSSVDWFVWTRGGVMIAFSMLNHKFCFEEWILPIRHSIYHAHDWKWRNLHSCNWCIVHMYIKEGVAISIQILKNKDPLG